VSFQTYCEFATDAIRRHRHDQAAIYLRQAIQEFDESEHPRDEAGKFTSGEGGGETRKVLHDEEQAKAFLKSDEMKSILTDGDKDVLKKYTDDYYYDTNQILIKQAKEGIPISEVQHEFLKSDLKIEDVEKTVKQLDETLQKMPTYEGKVERRFDIEPGSLNAFLSVYKPGETVKFPAYTSTSTRKMNFGENVNMNILANGKRGHPIFDLSLRPLEREILFERGTSFKVDSVEKISDKITINLSEI
jgi:hypothetical protein